MNLAAVQLLQEWDPFDLGQEQYDTEAADVVAALQSIDDSNQLAQLIQTVFEYSFEQMIPLEVCVTVANKLLVLKVNLQCSI